MERQDDRPTTADIASQEEVRHEGTKPELDEDVRERARPQDEAGESTELEGGPLLADEVTDDFGKRWEEIQVGFVDEPRRAVQEADALVAELMQRLADSFSEERARLESQWDRGDEVSTEELRVVLQRYRSFFGRLLAA